MLGHVERPTCSFRHPTLSTLRWFLIDTHIHMYNTCIYAGKDSLHIYLLYIYCINIYCNLKVNQGQPIDPWGFAEKFLPSNFAMISNSLNLPPAWGGQRGVTTRGQWDGSHGWHGMDSEIQGPLEGEEGKTVESCTHTTRVKKTKQLFVFFLCTCPPKQKKENTHTHTQNCWHPKTINHHLPTEKLSCFSLSPRNQALIRPH